MPHHGRVEVSGRIGDIFAHRFVIETADGVKLLADLGPEGAAVFPLETGSHVTASGERKPSELKVERIARAGQPAVAIPHKPKPHHAPKHDPHGADAKPERAVEAVREAGFEPLGAPRRKPKHFEVLARSGHAYVECHVEFDGRIRKEKVVAAQDPKWADDIRRVA